MNSDVVSKVLKAMDVASLRYSVAAAVPLGTTWTVPGWSRKPTTLCLCDECRGAHILGHYLRRNACWTL
jgi:hypothetical protein